MYVQGGASYEPSTHKFYYTNSREQRSTTFHVKDSQIAIQEFVNPKKNPAQTPKARVQQTAQATAKDRAQEGTNLIRGSVPL